MCLSVIALTREQDGIIAWDAMPGRQSDDYHEVKAVKRSSFCPFDIDDGVDTNTVLFAIVCGMY